MLTSQIIPARQIRPFIDALARQSGFVCVHTQRGLFRTISAMPARQWVLPGTADAFRDTVSLILAEHRQLGSGHAHAGIAGSLFYEAGQHTVPGFRCSVPGTEPCGWLGLYLWSLVVPASADAGNEARLGFHPDCDAATRQRVLACLETPDTQAVPEDQSKFAISEPFAPLRTAADYRRDVGRILDYIQAGDCYQVNLSQQFRGRYQGSPWHAWKALVEAIPVPHGGYLDAGDWQLLSVSPEMFLEIRGPDVTSKPIKGTRARHEDPKQDQALARELTLSPKDQAENLMIVDLIRNDLSHFCEPFSVKVPQLFEVESFRNVHQLVSTVTGKLRQGTTPLEALLSAFPGGSITGAPKRRAMEVIRELEPFERGPYCGSLLWWGADNSLESNIAIRSLQTLPDGEILAWAGCGIVADSDPDEEFRESITKIRTLLLTLERLGSQQNH